MQDKIQRITPFLWLDTQAEEAVNFYVSVFGNSKVSATTQKARKAMGAMLKMKKIDLDALRQAMG